LEAFYGVTFLQTGIYGYALSVSACLFHLDGFWIYPLDFLAEIGAV
jgi:hypothetical protein